MADIKTRMSEIKDKIRQSPEYQIQKIVIDFTENVCQAMSDLRMSRKDLAKKLGVSKSYISQVLNGKKNVTVDTLVRFTRAVGIDLTINTENPRITQTSTVSVMPTTLIANTVQYTIAQVESHMNTWPKMNEYAFFKADDIKVPDVIEVANTEGMMTREKEALEA